MLHSMVLEYTVIERVRIQHLLGPAVAADSPGQSMHTLQTVVAANIGPYKKEMQDAHILKGGLTSSLGVRYTIDVVLDGHGGTCCAQYVRAHLPTVLQTQVAAAQTRRLTGSQAIGTALVQCFDNLHRDFVSSHPAEISDSMGSCALICVSDGARYVLMAL